MEEEKKKHLFPCQENGFFVQHRVFIWIKDAIVSQSVIRCDEYELRA